MTGAIETALTMLLRERGADPTEAAVADLLMLVDASAPLAILQREPGADDVARTLARAGSGSAARSPLALLTDAPRTTGVPAR